MYLLALFIVQIFKQSLKAEPAIWQNVIFGVKNSAIAPNNFLHKNYEHNFDLPLGPSFLKKC